MSQRHYRCRPIVVSAIQWDGGSLLPGMFVRENHMSPLGYGGKTKGVATRDGFVPMSKGDWLVAGPKAGELSVFPDGLFQERFEEAEVEASEQAWRPAGTPTP